MCVHPKAQQARAERGDKGESELTVAAVWIWVQAETAPAQLSNERHTSPVPGCEAVEATGVSSVGAIEPASSSQYQTVWTSDGRRRGIPESPAPPGGGGWWSHLLNSITDNPTGAKRKRSVPGGVFARTRRVLLGGLCRRPRFAQTVAREVRMRERVVGQDAARGASATPRPSDSCEWPVTEEREGGRKRGHRKRTNKSHAYNGK